MNDLREPLFKRFNGKEGAKVCLEALKEQAIVRGQEALARALCWNHTLHHYNPGEIIFNQGDWTCHIIFILAGKVAIHRNNRKIAERNAGECVGEMALIDVKFPRSATVIAQEISTIAVVSQADFAKIAKKFPELWRDLAKHSGHRLRQRLEGVRPQNDTPKIFIGSSSESLAAAKAVEKSLKPFGEIIPWTRKDVFSPGKFILEALEDQAQQVDFAVMVFGPDDVIFSRGKRFEGPRDNVVFELGLFMGAIGRERTFIVTPKGKKIKFPTDLLGINDVRYSFEPTKKLVIAVNEACEILHQIISENGPL